MQFFHILQLLKELPSYLPIYLGQKPQIIIKGGPIIIILYDEANSLFSIDLYEVDVKQVSDPQVPGGGDGL
jgi:hypothetical protein